MGQIGARGLLQQHAMPRDVSLPPDTMGSQPSGSADAELSALLAGYAARLPGWAEELEARLAAGDLDALRSDAHQLKGTAGAYGFLQITEAAAALEACLGPRVFLAAVRDRVARVAALCRAAGGAA